MNNLALFPGTSKDGRQAPRKLLMCPVLVSVNNGPAYKARTTDISSTGIGLILVDKLPENTRVKIQLTIFTGDVKDTYVLDGTTVFCIVKGMEGYRVGLALTSMAPALAKRIESLPTLG